MSQYLPAPKRQRVIGQGEGNSNNSNFIAKSRNDVDYNNNNNMKPSLVVHARNLSDTITESDIYQALERFGKISYVIIMSKKRQALVEFVDINGSMSCVGEANRSGVHIAGLPVYLNYSSSQKIIRPRSNLDDDNKPENHILLFTILNPLYPITVDVMRTICSSVAKVLRVVIFRKNGVQAMVELENIDAAKRVRQALNGADVYSGCCTLKIEYAKPTKLNVVKNDQESWDYTTTEDIHDAARKQPLLQTPYYVNGKATTPYNVNPSSNYYESDNSSFNKNNGNYMYSVSSGRNNGSSTGSNNNYNNSRHSSSSAAGASQNNFMMSPNGDYSSGHRSRNMPPDALIPSLMSNDEAAAAAYANGNVPLANEMINSNQIVLMIYNLCPNRFNCDRLFNLLCLYGNVDRIKFLISKEGSAMVQMSNADPIFSMLSHLNNTYIFGKKFQIHISKQNILQPVPRPKDLPDGTTSYRDYQGNRNNRYLSGEAANKNKPLSPANVLHWFNAPPGMTDQHIIDVFIKAGAKPPIKVKVFPKKSEKSSTGLVEWNNIADCVEALILTNHSEISHPSSKFPYIFKLCFSATPILDGVKKD